jgi:hypothetical protein
LEKSSAIKIHSNMKIYSHRYAFIATGMLCFAVKAGAQNVGIGTSIPLDKLHVVGNIRSTTLAGIGNRMVMADPNGTLIISTAPGTTNPAWTILGNAGTSAATNFIGTVDANDWVVRTNNVEQMRVLSTGNVGIGITAPTAKLHVQVTAGVAIRGTQTGFGSGYLGYSGAISLGTFGVTPGAVVFSEEGTATTNPSLIAVTRNPASYAACIGYSDVWIGGYFGVDNPSTTFNPPAVYGQLNEAVNFGSTVFQNAVVGYLNRGAIAGNASYSVGVSGISNSQSQDGFGVTGRVYCNNTATISSGGYFESNTYAGGNNAFAYVANNGLNRKIAGSGSVSEIIPTPTHGRIILTCPESPEYWYQDYGTVIIANGHAHVDLDPVLADIIFVNTANPLRVFCTPVDMPSFNGITITNRSETGFDILELNGGAHSGTLEYELVVKPKTNYGEGRFMQAPGPLGLKPENEPAAAKAQNRPEYSQIWHWPSDPSQYGYVIPKQEPLSTVKTAEKK